MELFLKMLALWSHTHNIKHFAVYGELQAEPLQLFFFIYIQVNLFQLHSFEFKVKDHVLLKSLKIISNNII